MSAVPRGAPYAGGKRSRADTGCASAYCLAMGESLETLSHEDRKRGGWVRQSWGWVRDTNQLRTTTVGLGEWVCLAELTYGSLTVSTARDLMVRLPVRGGTSRPDDVARPGAHALPVHAAACRESAAPPPRVAGAARGEPCLLDVAWPVRAQLALPPPEGDAGEYGACPPTPVVAGALHSLRVHPRLGYQSAPAGGGLCSSSLRCLARRMRSVRWRCSSSRTPFSPSLRRRSDALRCSSSSRRWSAQRARSSRRRCAICSRNL